MSKGLFWSYAADSTFEQISDDILIEHTLKCADFDDIVDIFGCMTGKSFL